MRYLALHRKVHVWFNNWFAVQVVLSADEWGFGIRPVFRRRLFDIYLGPVTLAFGHHPYLTDARVKHRDNSRGFIFEDSVEAGLL